MTSEFLSFQFNELETLFYENTETWFIWMQSILNARDMWISVSDIVQVCWEINNEESEWDNDSLLFLQVSKVLQFITSVFWDSTSAQTSVEDLSIMNLSEIEKKKIRKLIKKKNWLKENKTAIAILLEWISSIDVNVMKEY